MQKHALVLTTFAFILAVGAMAASAQQIPDVATTPQQPRILQQQQEQERQLQGVQTPVISRDEGGMGWGYGPGWRHHQTGVEEAWAWHDRARGHDGAREHGSPA
jgi:hypothetical protein